MIIIEFIILFNQSKAPELDGGIIDDHCTVSSDAWPIIKMILISW